MPKRNTRISAARIVSPLLAAITLMSGEAFASNLDLREIGAMLVLPILTGGPDVKTTTHLAVTNAGGPVRLHLNVLSGDPGDNWRAQNFDCPVTASETVLFTFTADPDLFNPDPDISVFSYECSNTQVVNAPLVTRNGLLVITVEDANGLPLNTNQLFGDAVVLDVQNALAYSMGAISFQGITPLAGEVDREYRFDNFEYSAFPSALATNYVTASAASLILFTLDGTPDTPNTPEAALSIKFSIGSGPTMSASYAFDCFAIVDLASIDPGFGIPGVPNRAGHLVLTPESVNYSNLAHDAKFDGGPGSQIGERTPPVHGWIVQVIDTGAQQSPFVFARTLLQSGLPHMPSPGDVPVLNAR